MCGIAGIVSNIDSRLKESAISEMTHALAHRGPDAEGTFVNEYVALGHRRLSIIDLSPDANQPFWDAERRYALIFNGEVYNYKEVRNKLSGYPFRTKSDTEVVLAAYQKWGADCLQHFAGMFAMAVWDDHKKQLFIARDRMGIKPLYFSEKEGQLLFASELRAILSSGLIEKKLSKNGLYDYLTYQTVHAPNTILEDIKQLEPGTYAFFQNGKLVQKKYWDMTEAQYKGEYSLKDFDGYDNVKANVRRLFRQSVERRMVSDVPLGAFLSGGIDSSAVVAMMAEVADQRVETFSVNFEEEQFDESKYSDLIAEKYRTNHHPILLKPTDFLDALPEALASMDAPTGDGVNTFVVSQKTKTGGVTVALSGLGGDELFGGYSLFGNFLRLNRHPVMWNIPIGFRKAGATLANMFAKSHQRGRVMELASAANGSIEEVYPAFRKLLTKKELGNRMNGSGHSDAVRQMLLANKDIGKMPLLSQLTVADISTYTQNVLLKDTDQFSMAHALEVRVPFFDHNLVEYMVQVPDKHKPLVFTKKLLVDALHPMLPDAIVHRPKQGFDLPWKLWMKNELHSFCKERIDSFNSRRLVAEGLLDGMWDDFAAGKNDQLWSRIWIFVVLEDWLRRLSIKD